MKYLVLIYSNPEPWGHPAYLRDPRFRALPAHERAEVAARADAFGREIVESGELLGGAALDAPSSGRTVRVRDGVRLVTDGPYAETKEHLAGYVVVDCESPERASEIVSGIPDARFAAIEIRPLGEPAEIGKIF